MEMTRGEMLDLLAKFSNENPAYRKALLNDPQRMISEQFQMDIPSSTTIKVVEDSADTVHVVLPHAVQAGAELSDADLEAVAGGHTVVKDASCEGGNLNTVIAMEASLF